MQTDKLQTPGNFLAGAAAVKMIIGLISSALCRWSRSLVSWQLLRCGESTTPTLGSYSKAIRLLCLSLCLELI